MMTYINYLNVVNRYPGIQGMGYSQYVKAENLEVFINNNKQPDGNAFKIEPKLSKDYYVVNIFVSSGKLCIYPTMRLIMFMMLIGNKDSIPTKISG